MAELLTAVVRVCDSNPRVAIACDVAHIIDAFLCFRFSHWSLESAAKRGFPRLMDRLLEREWSGFNRQWREMRLCHGINKAIRRGYDIQVMEWWFRRYIPDQDLFPIAAVYEIAIRNVNISVLEWVYQETRGDLPRIKRSVSIYFPDTLAWLLDHGDRYSCNWLSLCKMLKIDAHDFYAIKRCLIHEDEDNSFTFHGSHKTVNEALAYGQLADLQWLYEHRPAFFGPNILRNAVRLGNLDAAKWLVKTFPLHYFSNPKQTYQSFEGLRPYKYNFEMVKWVLSEFEWRKDRKRNDWMREAWNYAAQSGKLEMLEFVYHIRVERYKSAVAVSRAVRKWANASPPILDQVAAIGHMGMDNAAGNGHLEAVRWLHENRSEGCTAEAMDAAASEGHLEVVRWLHENRSEGCTTQAMDRAAKNGHLAVVQWLTANRSEGCTKKAMNAAANNGHLEVVQWLHDYRSEGCTTKAMDCAAGNGHLKVVRFLHKNRREGCTADAVLQAASNGQYTTFKWLYESRPELLASEWYQHDGFGYLRILRCQALYTEHDRLEWFVNKFMGYNDFHMLQLLLSNADTKTVPSFETWFSDGAISRQQLEQTVNCLSWSTSEWSW